MFKEAATKSRSVTARAINLVNPSKAIKSKQSACSARIDLHFSLGRHLLCITRVIHFFWTDEFGSNQSETIRATPFRQPPSLNSISRAKRGRFDDGIAITSAGARTTQQEVDHGMV